MDDAQTGPGSWQASDGKWYGPEQHPDPSHRARWSSTAPGGPDPSPAGGPPPSPAAGQASSPGATVTAPSEPPPALPSGDGRISPPPPRVARSVAGQAGVIDRRPAGRPDGRFVTPAADPGSGGLVRRVLVGVLAVALLVGVGVAAYVLAGGSGDDGGADETGATVEGDRQADPDDTTSVTDATDEPQVVMVDDRLAVTFPGNWAVTEPGDGPAAEELFPDDSAAAAVFDQNLSQQDESALVFAADRESFDGGVLTSVVASFVTYADGAGFDSVASVARPSLEAGGGVVERQEEIALGETEAEALRVNYRVTTPGLEFTGLQVVVDGGDGAFVLTFQTDSSGDDTAVVDEIVDSIEIE